MNWRTLSPAERQQRRKKRKRGQDERYYPRRKILMVKWKNARLKRLLPAEALACIQVIMPTDDRLHDFAPHGVFKRRIEEILDECMVIQRPPPADPLPGFIEAAREQSIATPTLKLWRYRPSQVQNPIIINEPDQLLHLVRTTSWTFVPSITLEEGARNSCPMCVFTFPGKMTIHRREGRDTVFRSWCCGLVRGSWELIFSRYGGQGMEHCMAVALAILKRPGSPSNWSNDVWEGDRSALVWRHIFRGRHYFMAGVQRGKHLSAFGDWARYCRAAVETVHTFRPITMAQFQRREYLLRIHRTFLGEIARIDVYTLKFKPLFTHWIQEPQPVIEVPWWADFFPWNRMLVTYDRATADRLERHELSKPFEQRTPVALLPPETEVAALPFECTLH